MGYRNGTYVAFSGNNTTDPTKSDIKYFNILKGWNSMKRKEFKFNDSHQKTYQVRDTSQISTLEKRLLDRMRDSKNMLLILTEISKYNQGMLGFEIEKVVDVYKLPIIVAYPKKEAIISLNKLRDLWPKELKNRIDDCSAKCIHIPFKECLIADAIERFTVHNNSLSNGVGYYSKETYKSLNLL